MAVLGDHPPPLTAYAGVPPGMMWGQALRKRQNSGLLLALAPPPPGQTPAPQTQVDAGLGRTLDWKSLSLRRTLARPTTSFVT